MEKIGKQADGTPKTYRGSYRDCISWVVDQGMPMQFLGEDIYDSREKRVTIPRGGIVFLSKRSRHDHEEDGRLEVTLDVVDKTNKSEISTWLIPRYLLRPIKIPPPKIESE